LRSAAARLAIGALAFRRSAAALATGYHPDGSAPDPRFPPPAKARCFARFGNWLRLSTLRADRSCCRPSGEPEPPGSGLQIRARGPPLLRLRKCPRDGALD